jgi:hypothetical protein
VTNDIGSALIRALEAAYKGIQTRHPALPPVIFITGQGFHGKRKRLGHYAHGAWRTGKAGAHEIFVAGEIMQKGSDDTFATILHEAVHALAGVRKVKDTTRGGRYHNQRFVALAVELGMEYAHEGPHAVLGFSDVTLTTATKDLYKHTIAALDAALKAHRPEIAEKAKVPSRNNLKLVCGCNRVIRASTTVMEEGPIVCGVCGDAFAAAE